MAGKRYDSEWKEVQDINGAVWLLAYAVFAFKGIGILVVTWTTVVLLGGFVSMIDKKDFWNLMVITLVELLWIDSSFTDKMNSALALLSSSMKAVPDLLTGTDKARGDLQELPVIKRVVAAVRRMVVLAHGVLLCSCIIFMFCFLFYGLYSTVVISIRGLKERGHYGEADEARINMDPAHTVLYILCLAQGALFLYRLAMYGWLKIRVKLVSEAYGFHEGDPTVSCYFHRILEGCLEKPSSAGERNLITYAIELMESRSAFSDSFHSGTLILERLLTRQQHPKLIEGEEERQQQHRTEQKIIGQQRRIIKMLIIGSASSADILQKLLQTLEPRCSDDRKLREAAARIVEHVADSICLGQLPQGIHCISALINTFEEYHRPQPHQWSSSSNTNTLSSESDSEHSEAESELATLRRQTVNKRSLPMVLRDFWGFVSASINDQDKNRSKTNPFHGYKELVLTGLRILWSLAGNEENCTIISNTEHLVSKIMAPTSYDLVHRAGHSAWSTMVTEGSLGVMLRLIVTAKGDTRVNLRQQISNHEGAINTMETIVTCDECRGGQLQMKAMQILTELYMDKTANKGNLMKMLASIFTSGDNSNASIRRVAGKTLVMLFLGSKSVASLLPKEENDKFVGDLAKMLLHVGDHDTRKSAAEMLEHLCIQYTENGQYLSTLKDTMIGLMPKVLREILSWLTGEEGNPGYAISGTDVESQVTTNNDKKKSSLTSSSPGKNKHHKPHVPLLSLCVTACEELHLDLDRIFLGGGDQAGDQGECVSFRLAMKMVQIKRDLITADNLKAMKLITRMLIATMKKLTDHDTVVERADLEGLIDSLTSISETMLDLEGSMVFAVGTVAIPATVDTLDSLVKQARQLLIEIMNQESEINVT